MEEREELVCGLAVDLKNQGHHIYCPIAETAALAKHAHLLGTSWEDWREHDLVLLDRCDELWIAMIDGWQQSKGVRGELKFALQRGIPVCFVNLDAGFIVHQELGGCLAMFDIKDIDELND